MEQASLSYRRQTDQDFNLKEWALKAKMISRENTNSRRFSASNIRSFREEAAKSFRSNATISSTASSPGYSLKDEIDPSNYSFTTALRALQARSGYVWECLSPDGFALNSKWNDAERYICNPLSGEVPIECLSVKTLSGRSFHSLSSRITMSGPLGYSSHFRVFQAKPSVKQVDEIDDSSVQEKKIECLMTRDIGTQSTPPDLSSSSPSPASTPSIRERSIKCCEIEAIESPNYITQLKSEEDQVEGKELEKRETEEGTRKDDDEVEEEIKEEQKVCKCRQGGCFLWTMWVRKRNQNRKKIITKE
ncbi:hypothetical protein Scep_016611 [Stephania cephalantha]|uniref:Uncharacterized protein n=1 Tax=Stephania cephalantha TaxID=152367 RepID=A0AAP0IP88_9MAGN